MKIKQLIRSVIAFNNFAFDEWEICESVAYVPEPPWKLDIETLLIKISRVGGASLKLLPY